MRSLNWRVAHAPQPSFAGAALVGYDGYAELDEEPGRGFARATERRACSASERACASMRFDGGRSGPPTGCCVSGAFKGDRFGACGGRGQLT